MVSDHRLLGRGGTRPYRSGRPDYPSGEACRGLDELGAPADLILVGHIHPNHYDTNSLYRLKTTNTIIVAPKSVFDLMPSDLQAITVVLTNTGPAAITNLVLGKDTTNVASVTVQAIAAYNTTPGPLTPFHPRIRGDNGYVFTLADQRIYFSGDTEDVPEMRALTNINVAFVCMNPPFTMTIDQAASAVREFKPKIIYPNGFLIFPNFSVPRNGSVEDVFAFKQLVGTNSTVRIRSTWYPGFE